VLGQLVTSFRAGMADPIWPTEPWYLLSNYKLDFGYLIEHTHRLAAFSVGGIVILLALGSWWTEPRALPRWLALCGVAVLVMGYGEFHRGLIAQRSYSPGEVQLPTRSLVVIAVGLVVVFGVALTGILLSVRGAGVRLLASFALVAVMIQGLLGGFRVMLNELVGTDLAAVHGVFAQIVLSLMVALAVLTERPRQLPAQVHSPDKAIGRAAIVLTILLFIQIIWGAIIRHNPTPLMQRLHFLTAFVALTLAVLILRSVFTQPSIHARVGIMGALLVGLLTAQLYLGVEAWMLKFGAYTLPELVRITPEGAAIRTLHALIGSGILAVVLTLALRLRRPQKQVDRIVAGRADDWNEPPLFTSRTLETASRFHGESP
jgi:heme A synthase